MHPPREPQDPAEALALVRRYLRATYRIAEAALRATDLQELYGRVHAIVRDLMPAENLYFALWERASGTVSFPYFVDTQDPAPEPRKLRRGLTEYVLRTEKPLLLDWEVLKALEGSGEVEPIGTDSLDWLGAPLVGTEGVFGVLAIQIYEGNRHYTPEERDLLVFVCGQVAMAIERRAAEDGLKLSEEKFSKAFQASPDAINLTRLDGALLDVNEAFTRMSGWTREEALGRTTLDLRLWADLAERDRAMDLIRRNGSFNDLEASFRMKDGSRRTGILSGTIIHVDGQPCMLSITRDITERKAVEAALRRSEDKFSRAFHATPDAINLSRLTDGTYLDVSEGFTRLTGWAREDAIGHSALDLGIWVHPEDRARAVELIREFGEFTGLEATFRRKDGTILTGLMSGKVMEVDGAPCLLSITRDITDRKAAEQALRSAERRIRTVLAYSQAIIYQLDPEGRFILSEGLGLTKIGLRPGEMVGHSVFDGPGWDPLVLIQVRRALQGQASRETAHLRERIFDNLLTPVFDDHGHLESVIGIATDITERQRAEEELLAERGLFVGGPVMVIKWRVAEGWPVDYVSPNILAILGYAPEDLVSGRVSYNSLVHPDEVEAIHSAAAEFKAQGLNHYEQQYRLRTAAGEYRWFYDFSTAVAGQGSDPGYHLGYLLDLTDRRRAEEALRQSQKLESLGVLAGGIAHDFNNLLTVVLGNLNLAQIKLPDVSPVRPYLANMEATVLRATELTKQMLAYSGRGHFQVRPHDLNAVVRDLTHLLEVSISKKIRLQLDLEPDLPAIQADAAQFQQVVMNLVTNASDAIGDHEGAIHLTTSVQDLDAPTLRDEYRLDLPKPGRHVILEVEDTGCGMTAGVMERIFDPFFTTKATGRGLGLSAMLGILRGHGAGLNISSEVGRGSRFRLCFPASTEATLPEPPADQVPSPAPLQGLVLLVDDEEQIRDATGLALDALGFRVVTAQNGLEALDRFQEHRKDLCLVIMDLTMPRMDGREAFRAMRGLDPAIPVVLSSGFTEQDSLQTFPDGGPAGFLQKPYQIKDLKTAIQRALEG
jgi:PAS domain S-box-containing protein